MLSFRTILPDLLKTRLFSYPRVIYNSSVLYTSSTLENEYQHLTSRMSLRTLCTKPSLDYPEAVNKMTQSKHSLTKQIIVRGKAATAYQEELINNFLAKYDTATPDEWQQLVTDIFGLEFGMINEINVDGKIVECCVIASKLDLARSYLTYMKSQKKKFNGAVVTSFIKVCYVCKDSMTEQDQTRIRQFTDFLLKRYAVADGIICEGLVKGFVLQRKIDDALQTIVKNESMCSINHKTYSAAAWCLLEMDYFDKAVNFIAESLNKVSTLSDEVYVKWIGKSLNDKNKLEKLLSVFQLYDIKPAQLICDHLIAAFQSLSEKEKLVGSYGTINNRGKCSECQTVLEPLELEREEFEELRVTFLNNVLVGEDVFKNTTPKELNRFFKLVESEAPFDVVIDGLNVAFMVGTKNNPSTFVNLIQHVIKHFREQEMKILLLGRQHMKKWPRLIDVLNDLECHYFLMHDLSEDDPFMLYATMFSGIGTSFVTRDLLRTEKFRLQSEKFAPLFKRWQQAHQIFVSYISPSGRVYTRTPLTFQMSVQRNKFGVWHIPYEATEDSQDDYGIHRKWLCLKKPIGEMET